MKLNLFPLFNGCHAGSLALFNHFLFKVAFFALSENLFTLIISFMGFGEGVGFIGINPGVNTEATGYTFFHVRVKVYKTK